MGNNTDDESWYKMSAVEIGGRWVWPVDPKMGALLCAPCAV
jgi:hypothetical protein